MKSRRRTNEVVGYVNFPVTKVSSGEGGCFVRLVVVESSLLTDYIPQSEPPSPEEIETNAEQVIQEPWAPCCGGLNYFYLDGNLSRYDHLEPPPWPEFDEKRVEEKRQAYAAYEKALLDYEHILFPSLNLGGQENDYGSRGCLAVVTIGATGWSPLEPWHCTYDDLTANGKVLYDSLKNLYGDKGVVILVTFLDT